MPYNTTVHILYLLENGFIRESLEGRFCFFYYRGEEKKNSFDSLGETIYK
jgi:hypothetical protein